MNSLLPDAAVVLLSGFFDEPQAAFVEARDTFPWSFYKGKSGRQHATFGRDYYFSGQLHRAAPTPQLVIDALARLNNKFGCNLNSCYANLYADGKSSIGYHTDAEPQLVRNAPVVSISLGADTTFWFKHKQSHAETSVILKDNDVCIMGRGSQSRYLHSVKPEAGRGARISLTFREFR